MKMLPNFPPLITEDLLLSLGRSPPLPVMRRLKIVLSHEVKDHIRRLVTAFLNRVYLSEQLSGAFPVTDYVLVEALVKHVEERLAHER